MVNALGINIILVIQFTSIVDCTTSENVLKHVGVLDRLEITWIDMGNN